MFKNKKIATLIIACTFLQTVANSQEVTVNNDFQNKTVQTQNDSIINMLKAMDAKNQAQFNNMNNEILNINKKTTCLNRTMLYNPTATNADPDGCVPSYTAQVATIAAYYGTSAPAGWLECNGSTFNAATYPKLAAVLGGNRLPDLRGEFIRGWDHGRGVDSGRAIGTRQVGSRIITNSFIPPHVTANGKPVGGLGGGPIVDRQGLNTNLEETQLAFRGLTVYLTPSNWISTTVPVFAANAPVDGKLADGSPGVNAEIYTSTLRPRNVAFMYIIKAQ